MAKFDDPIRHANLGNGYALRSTATSDPNTVKHEIEKNGKLERTLYVRK